MLYCSMCVMKGEGASLQHHLLSTSLNYFTFIRVKISACVLTKGQTSKLLLAEEPWDDNFH